MTREQPKKNEDEKEKRCKNTPNGENMPTVQQKKSQNRDCRRKELTVASQKPAKTRTGMFQTTNEKTVAFDEKNGRRDAGAGNHGPKDLGKAWVSGVTGKKILCRGGRWGAVS